MKNNKGFSLVELIIVIAIMAILVGVMAPMLIQYIEKSKVSSDLELLGAVSAAVVYATADPNVVLDDDSKIVMNNMVDGIRLQDLNNPTDNKLYLAVLDTLGWPNLQQTTYEPKLKSAHEPDSTIWLSYNGNFYNPVTLWITHTDASANKETDDNPTDPDSIVKCITIR